MFRIYDGREHFYQWDSDCKLIIDDGRISAVHFCNRTIDYAIVCNVYTQNGQYLVNVPNIFFQSDRDLHVYAYDDNHTLYEETYKVYARSKPADYVYKDDEVLTWARIEQRVTDLENTVSTEGIAQAVEDYMAANPIEIPAEYVTDSELEAKGYITTIPDEYITEEELSSKGYLTSIPAEYVTETELNAKGYLTEHQDLSGYALKSEIPDDYILPTASATTLGGVKIGSGLSITDDGVLSAEGGGGAEVPIATVDTVGTVKPDGTSITIAEDGTISGAGENVLKAYNGYSVNLTRQIANKINGGLCVAAGGYNTLNGYYGFTSGSSNILSNDNGTTFGRNNTINGMVGFISGDYCQVDGYRGAAFGSYSFAGAENSFVIGDHAVAKSKTQFVHGRYNLHDSTETYAHIVGNGTNALNASNAYTLDWSGNAVFAGTVSNSGADYAEYFEWLDGNTDNEDRVGFIVTLDGDKIKKANDGDDMLGIISGTMTVLGDDAEWYWHGRYLKDEFGRIQYHYVDEDVIECQRFENEDGTIEWRDVVVGKKQVLYPIVNPKYDDTKTYVSRKDRKEWDAVGMLGKLYVRDDGTCKVNQYAKCGNDGIATAADCITNMRVLQRVNDNIIRVLLK